ncbi:Uma2 family endonuclease [Streptomyces ficellus]|uniref:Uma2 family endonuclease n=2 Tax=Streptomyces ficellus TaxID=1977088 RepID=A0A6I6FXG3_9ACTN|nr:Uma2 family endonuclease [Streptomyces ficellus]
MPVEEAFETLNAAAPRGWRVELIEGEIHVTPPANGEQEEIVSEVTGQARDHRKDLGRYTGIGLFLPDASVSGRVQPDVVLAPKGSFADDAEYHDASAVLLVAEVTSRSTAGNDRVKKIRGYARAGIPVYLLIDRETEQVVVCTEPSGEDYDTKAAYKLGEVVPLPEPVGFDLDTGAF